MAMATAGSVLRICAERPNRRATAKREAEKLREPKKLTARGDCIDPHLLRSMIQGIPLRFQRH